ncbi:DUF937 domain-containing protein [Flavobacterium succinicans]|uniref:Uncharacterized protein n=1 Tax=Flavobacterium succinicans TaxID=29536 RepID=A0A199XRC0_9FLAO|nr:DUF937 domain-containing protein [Flavobacterium succinicans]OAZ03967.1 hypothetical protein FLB_16570 [Flavobacterium succinicans]
MSNLVSHFKNLISNDLFLRMSVYLDEKDASLRKAIETSICTVLVGVEKSIDFQGILCSLEELDVVDEQGMDGLHSNGMSFSSGQLFLDKLFSSKKDRIYEMISNEVCVKSETARAILNLVAMVILANLKKEPPKNLRSLLESQSHTLYGYLPRGVKLILGIPNVDYGSIHLNEKERTFFSFSFFRSKR